MGSNGELNPTYVGSNEFNGDPMLIWSDLIVIKWDSGFVLTNFSHLLGTTEGIVIKHGFVHGVVHN